MSRRRPTLAARTLRRFVGVTLLALVLSVLPAVAADGKSDSQPVTPPPAPSALNTKVPENVQDLKNLEKQVKAVVEKVTPATVGLELKGVKDGKQEGWSGSGVIVSEDGLVLTAGHVSDKPGNEVIIIFPDGKKVKGKSLGWNKEMDSGMVKINDEAKYPYCEMGHSAALKKGQWVISIGHPGGFKNGRTPVVRLGRIQSHDDEVIRTDCTLVGGDSGGPLFDLDGKVIGIHSRIGPTVATNLHVPVDTYRNTWDRLVKGDVMGRRIGLGDLEDPAPYLGLTFGDKTQVDRIESDSPASKAGIKEKDVVTKFDGSKVENLEELRERLAKKKPGDEVTLEIRRGDKDMLTFKVVLGKKS